VLAENAGSVDLEGNIAYDWQQLAPLWQPYVGNEVQIAGQQTKAFSLHGPIRNDLTASDSWKGVEGTTAVGWTAMNVHGLAVGQGELSAQIGNGQVRVLPVDVAVSEGRLTAAPVLRFQPAPAELFLG